jgi:hypothetical protein
MDGGKPEPPASSSEGKSHDVVRTRIASEALLKEYDFVTSMIPLYRGFEMQALHLGVLVFAAATGFVASAWESGNLELVFYIAAFLPWPMTTLMLVIAGSEVRIRRASLHIDQEITKRFARYTEVDDILTWEHSPSRLLSRSQRRFAGSWTFIAVIAFPAMVGGLTAIVGGILEPKHRIALLTIGGVGLLLLTFVALVPISISQKHEGRKGSVNPAHANQSES